MPAAVALSGIVRSGREYRASGARILREAETSGVVRAHGSRGRSGSAGWWVETLARLVGDGFGTLLFWPVDTATGRVELLAGDLVAHVRRCA
jgi:hypothetical protein